MASDYYRIEQAIKYIEDNHHKQPNLDQLAHYLDMSPFHFQRLFRRWVGISPKRFLQFLTLEHAKGLLKQSHSILDTTFETGLSSPGRLHDLFVTIEAVTPGQFKLKGDGLIIYYGVHETPFGECLLAVTERGICGLSFIIDGDLDTAISDLQARWPRGHIMEKPSLTRPFIRQIFSPEIDERRDKIILHLNGTNFQIKVWEALLRIPPGQLYCYEDLAKAIGNPGAVRAVASAVADNPVAYVIPCHRVIRKMGIFGNYRYGPARKKAMIAWEAAKLAGVSDNDE